MARTRSTTSGARTKWRQIALPPPGARWVGYRRYSERDKRVGDKHTFDMQAQEIQAFALAHGWSFAGWYDEPAQTGAAEEIEQRPVFAQLLTDAATETFTVVLTAMSDRWARDTEIASGSLKRLRRAGVYWATADGQWDINKVIADGHAVAWVVDAEVNAAYARKQSQKAVAARRERAQAGYHNGRVCYGYRRAPSMAPPSDAPYNWRPPRLPAQPHPLNFTRLQQIGEWSALGLADVEIARRADASGWVLEHPHKGIVPWTKSFISELVTNPFPCEFAPGSGQGSIITPDGERIEGRHLAAWSWDLWRRMRAQRALRLGKRGHHTHHWTPLARLFSGVAICAGCGRPLHHQGRRTWRYQRGAHSYGADGEQDAALIGYYSVYVCASADSATPCPVRAIGRGWRAIRSDTIETLFADQVLTAPLPTDWRTRIVAELRQHHDDAMYAQLTARRSHLVNERQRVLFQHRYARIGDAEMLAETARIDEALLTLPTPERVQAEETQALAIGETFARHRDYWDHATAEQRGEMVRLLLQPYGLELDLLARVITRIRPYATLLPILRLALPAWRVDDDGWLSPPSGAEPEAPPSLTHTSQNSQVS